MNYPAVTNIPMPADLAREMEAQAARYGMDLPAFMAFLARVQVNQLDREFANSVKYILTKYPNAMRELAK